MDKLQATASALNVQKIERIQNPHLYQTYMLKKLKMSQDNGGVEGDDNSSMEPEEKISAVSMHKVLTGASVDSMVEFLDVVCILQKMLLIQFDMQGFQVEIATCTSRGSWLVSIAMETLI